MKFDFKGIQVSCHPSWEDFLKQDILKEINEIERMIGETPYTPSSNMVFRFLQFDLEKLKICILGQDPYPQEGAATGRAFEDRRILSWVETGENASIRNILKILHKLENNSENVSGIKVVRRDIDNGNFKIFEPIKLFRHWESQGVLLLNTALTCRVGKREDSNSHSTYWTCLTKKLIQFIDIKKPDTYWFLWGEHAKKYQYLLKNKDKCRFSSHPTVNSCRNGDFLFENHFKYHKEIRWINSER